MAAPAVGPSGAVYAVEPLPAVVEALRLNTRLFTEWAAAQGVAVAPIHAVHAGGGGRAYCLGEGSCRWMAGG
jgi:hypothetical protein